MLGVIVLWGIVPVLVKVLLSFFEPFSIAFIRLSQGWVLVLAVFLVRGQRVRDIQWNRWHLLGGIGLSLNFLLYALSLSYTTVSTGVLIVQFQYVTLAVLAVVVLRERLGVRKLAGMAIVLIGIGLVVSVRVEVSDLLAPRYALGNILMVFSGLGFGIYGLANKALAANTDTPTILLPMLTIAVAITGGLAATQFEARAEPTLASLVAAAALGLIGTGGSFILISEGMKRLSAALVGTITALTPIGQIMLAHLVLNEPLTWILAMGGGLILVGVLSMIYAENAQVREEVLR